MDYVNAFWVGGLICALVQILLDRTKLMPGRVMVLLVCSGAVFGFLNLYQPLIEFAGAGASVPLLGFGNTLWKWVYRYFYGRVYGQRSGNIGGAGIRLPGFPCF